MTDLNPNYHEVRRQAQRAADDYQMLVRLRKVCWFNKRGFVFNLVPRLDQQFGRDLEGELIRPRITLWRDSEGALRIARGVWTDPQAAYAEHELRFPPVPPEMEARLRERFGDAVPEAPDARAIVEVL